MTALFPETQRDKPAAGPPPRVVIYTDVRGAGGRRKTLIEDRAV
jgi:hypothetical protein